MQDPVLMTSASGFITLNTRWRFVYVDPQLPASLRGADIWRAFPQLTGTPFYQQAQDAMRRRVPAVLEDLGAAIEIYPTPGGLSIHWTRLDQPAAQTPVSPRATSFPALYEASRALRRLAESTHPLAHLDEYQKVEALLHQATRSISLLETRLNLALQVINEGFWDMDLPSGPIWRSESYTRIFNLPPHSIPNTIEWWTERIHPDDRQYVLNCFHNAVDGTSSEWICDYRFLPGDGSVRYVSDRAAITRDARGIAVRATGAILDLTDVKDREDALRTLERQRVEDAARVEIQRKLLDHREMERAQLARDLHDGPLQNLSGLAFSLQMLREISQEAETREMLQVASKDVHALVAELRAICNELRPPLLERFGLAKAMLTLAEDFNERHPSPRIELILPPSPLLTTGAPYSESVIDEAFDAASPDAASPAAAAPDAPAPAAPAPLPATVETALFRIFQEALNNAWHHAGAQTVRAALIVKPNQVTLTIHDDGKGFPTPIDWVTLARQGHFGLVGIKERAEAIGADLTIQSASGAGTTIEVVVDK